MEIDFFAIFVVAIVVWNVVEIGVKCKKNLIYNEYH